MGSKNKKYAHGSVAGWQAVDDMAGLWKVGLYGWLNQTSDCFYVLFPTSGARFLEHDHHCLFYNVNVTN